MDYYETSLNKFFVDQCIKMDSRKKKKIIKNAIAHGVVYYKT